jgi:hypothetical protein
MRARLPPSTLLALVIGTLMIAQVGLVGGEDEDRSELRTKRIVVESSDGRASITLGFADGLPFIQLSRDGLQDICLEVGSDQSSILTLGRSKHIVARSGLKASSIEVLGPVEREQLVRMSVSDAARLDIRSMAGAVRVRADSGEVVAAISDPVVLTLDGEEGRWRAYARVQEEDVTGSRELTLLTPGGKKTWPLSER